MMPCRAARYWQKLLVLIANQVLPFSTGVIGEPLPMQKLLAGIPDALNNLSEQGWSGSRYRHFDHRHQAQRRKPSIRRRRYGQITITGISKGSGMIKPNMATMLGYVATDAAQWTQNCYCTAA